MIDIETVGLKPGSRILAVGALRFDPFSDEKFDGIEFGVDDPTGKADPKTVEWWASPDRAEARAHLARLADREAIGALERYVRRFTDDTKSVEWWAKSPNFDMVLLESLAERTGTIPPWSFRMLRDVRTALAMFPEFEPSEFTPSAPLHSPLADCELQAHQVSEVLRSAEVM